MTTAEQTFQERQQQLDEAHQLLLNALKRGIATKEELQSLRRSINERRDSLTIARRALPLPKMTPYRGPSSDRTLLFQQANTCSAIS